LKALLSEDQEVIVAFAGCDVLVVYSSASESGDYPNDENTELMQSGLKHINSQYSIKILASHGTLCSNACSINIV
jgi:hypothetical protein